jgi:hypothetical protein
MPGMTMGTASSSPLSALILAYLWAFVLTLGYRLTEVLPAPQPATATAPPGTGPIWANTRPVIHACELVMALAMAWMLLTAM